MTLENKDYQGTLAAYKKAIEESTTDTQTVGFITTVPSNSTVNGNITTGTSGYYIPPTPAQPCPACGHCPTCGRGGHQPMYPQYPTYPYWPQNLPYITW